MRVNGVTYYQQYRKCGKPSCKTCAEGEGHGPYWYARDDSKVRYVGKALPGEIEKEWHTYRVAAAIARDLSKELLALQQRVVILKRYASGECLNEGERALVTREFAAYKRDHDLYDEVLARYLERGDSVVASFLAECGM